AEPYAQNQPERYPTKEPISVLIRVGQHPELLLASLTNLLSQNYPNLELLLLNQSGTDLTETLKQVPKLPRFVEVQAQGLDPVLARNLCLRLASGRYLFYLASGDRWHANHLLSHLKALATHRFVYSDVFRLPHRKTMASIERMARDLNNSPDLSRGSLLGQFVASTAISHRRSLLATLPLDPELLTAESELERWRELEAWRRAGLFGGQTLRYPDWDLQLLAIERIKPHRLRSMTCEYLDEAEPVPDGKPLLQRLQDSLGELTRIEAPALPELAVIVMAPQELAGLSALLPVQARVVLLAQGLEQPLPILPEASDVRSLRLSPCPLLELLAKGLAVAGARTVAVIPPGQLLRDPDPAARLAGLPGLAKREGVRALIGESWEPIVPTQLAEQWQRISILSATAADWQSWLQQRN
ncbi:MAG TPA: glycosyltransferase family A protein, partial [Candidatus Obscuribacterales bacterium]